MERHRLGLKYKFTSSVGIIRTIIDRCTREVLINIVISMFFCILLLNFLVAWWLFTCDYSFGGLQACFLIYSAFVAHLEVTHQEVTLSMELHEIQLQVVKFFLRESELGSVIYKLLVKPRLGCLLLIF